MVSRHFPVESHDAAVAYVLAEDARGLNVYTNMVAHEADLGPRQRGGAEQKVSASVLWVDIDRKGPGHAADALPETTADLAVLLMALPFEPSFIVDTGGGWHCYWKLDRPVDLRNEKTRNEFQEVSRALQKRLRAAAKSRGWRLDNTSDLARVLRPAGTHNHKPGRDVKPLVDFLYRRPAEGPSYDYATITAELLAPKAASSPTSTDTAADAEPAVDIIAAAKAAKSDPAVAHKFKEKPAPALSRRQRKNRARNYLKKMGPAIEGQGGDEHTFKAACVLRDFALDFDDALEVFSEWNRTCQPPWPDEDLAKKLQGAAAYATGEEGSKARASDEGFDFGSCETKHARCYRVMKTESETLTGRPGELPISAAVSVCP